MCSRAFETRSLPSSRSATHRGFAFYVAFPKSSIRPLSLPIYVARRPTAPLKRACFPTRSLLPSQLYLDRSHRSVLAPATLAALPSTPAIPDRVCSMSLSPPAPFASKLFDVHSQVFACWLCAASIRYRLPKSRARQPKNQPENQLSHTGAR